MYSKSREQLLYSPTVPPIRPYPEVGYKRIQKIIDLLLLDTGWTQIDQLQGIVLKRRVEDFVTKTDCYGYVFGDEPLEDAIKRLQQEGTPTKHVPGAIAFYFNR